MLGRRVALKHESPRAPSRGLSATILAASSLTVMANATIAPSLPALRDQFSGVPGIATLAGLVMTLPSLSVVLTASLAGWIADRQGARRLLLGSLLVYGLGGASGWLAADMPQILAGRIVLGVGVAGVMTAATALLGASFQGVARQRFMGLQGAAQSLGGVAFLLAGGALAGVSWRGPFLVYLLAWAVLVLAWVHVPREARSSRHAPATADDADGGGIGVVLALAVFGMLAFYIIPTKLPFRLRDLGEASALLAGVAVAASTIAGAVSALLFQRLRARVSPPSLFAMSFASMALGYAGIGLTPVPAGLYAGSAVAGWGVGLLMPNLMGQLLERVPESARGRAAGGLTTAVFLGQFASPLVSGPLSGWVGLDNTFVVFGVVCAVVAVACATAKGGRGGKGARIPSA
jgi:MFS family permease